MLCLRRSELELKLSFSERELTLIKQERDRFERQATHLTQKYKAVDVAIYEQLQAEHAQLKQQLADVQAELAGQQELAQQQVATEKAAAQKAAQSRQTLHKQVQDLKAQVQQLQVCCSWRQLSGRYSAKLLLYAASAECLFVARLFVACASLLQLAGHWL